MRMRMAHALVMKTSNDLLAMRAMRVFVEQRELAASIAIPATVVSILIGLLWHLDPLQRPELIERIARLKALEKPLSNITHDDLR